MNRLLVGDSDCRFSDILNALMNTVTVGELSSNWRVLARELGTHVLKINKFKQELNLGQNGIMDVVEELLADWRLRIGKHAKLTTLMHILEIKCGWKDLSDSLWDAFHTVVTNETTWTDLDPKTQLQILETKVEFFGSMLSLEEIIGNLKNIPRDNLLGKIITSLEIRDFVNGKLICLGKNRVQEVPSYYITRSLLTRRRISLKIFDKKCSDIFLVQNISFGDLSLLAKNEQVDRSSRQTKIITSRFLLMEFPQDFDRLCRISKGLPIHALRYENENFLWIKSHGDLHLIHENIQEEQEIVSETELSNKTETCVCIADSPGMGKTVLLTNIYHQHKQAHPEKIIIFRKFHELVPDLADNQETVEFESWLSHKLTENLLGRRILLEILKTNIAPIELFLDGFDEASIDKFYLAEWFFKNLEGCFKTMRIYVTTRTHRRETLEHILGTISYSTIPFPDSDQVKFLKEYWCHVCKLSRSQSLEYFANYLVSQVGNKVKATKSNFSGFPLQCAMLADIFKEDAEKHALTTSLKSEIFLDFPSIFELYKQLMKIRFGKLKEEDKRRIKDFHVIVAIMELFPEYTEAIQVTANFGTQNQYDVEIINAVGLVIVTKEGGDTWRFEFLHRTYAEFLFAEHFTRRICSGDPLNSLMADDFAAKLFIMSLKWIEWHAELRVNSKGCDIERIWKLIRTCDEVKQLRKVWMRVSQRLDLSVEEIGSISSRINSRKAKIEKDLDPLYWMLLFWTRKNGKKPRLHDLVRLLSSLRLNGIVDIVKKEFFKKDFQNSNLCLFLDACLADNHFDFENPAKPSFLKLVNFNDTDFYNILETCAFHDFSRLFQLISKNIQIQLDLTDQTNSTLSGLLCVASQYSTLDLVKHCCDLVKGALQIEISEIVYPVKYFDGSINFSPLHYAAQRGDYPIFDYLRKQYGKHFLQQKCLLHACAEQSLTDSELVVDEKLEIIHTVLNIRQDCLEEEEPEYGQTPLIINRVNLKILNFFLQAGANALKFDEDTGYNVAHKAAYYLPPNEFHDLVHNLINHGWNDVFDRKSVKQHTPIHVALQYMPMRHDTIQLILSSVKRNSTGFLRDMNEALYSAILGMQNRETLELIVKLGADPKHKTEQKASMLHSAAVFGNINALDYLISCGCNINARNNEMSTPLHIAVRRCQRNVHETVTRLICYHANATFVDIAGHTALWYAENGECMPGVCKNTIDVLRKASAEQSQWFFSVKNLLQRCSIL